jgi:hypothetical protein
MDFTTLSGQALSDALVLDFTSLDNDALSAAITDRRSAIDALFALDTPTVAQVSDVEALIASVQSVEAEQTERERIATDAAERFAAARQSFAVNDGVEDSEEDGDEDETEEAEEVEEADAEDGEDAEEGEEGEGEAVTTASARDRLPVRTSPRPSIASKVGRKTPRPKVAAAQEVVITAAADVEGFATGQRLSGLEQVAQAVQARVKGFPKFNQRAAERAFEESGGEPMLSKFGAASFAVDFDSALTASKKSGDRDYSVMQESIKAHKERVAASVEAIKAGGSPTLTAAGWCAPSPVVYNWIADYVVDGIKALPEVYAPRGGLQTTTGPQLAQTTYANPADFGFGGTEADAEAGFVGAGAKTCETIECPDFEDHRLDYTGYCWKIPILTEKAFPELVADAMRLSDALYAHKMNGRFISDILAGSTALSATGLGAVALDTVEALVQVAVKERRWWNIGENAIMEVTLPQVAKEIMLFDMARRSGLALTDVATEQKLMAHFAVHNLSVEFVADFEDVNAHVATPNISWPDTFTAIIYPSGTWAKAVEDVINLSAVYDAASLSKNEYTGVFFEQGVMTLKMGYRSHKVTIPVCNAGRTGAQDLICEVGSI